MKAVFKKGFNMTYKRFDKFEATGKNEEIKKRLHKRLIKKAALTAINIILSISAGITIALILL